jgi:HAD superfamily hydrolase (TIGR01509 family)
MLKAILFDFDGVFADTEPLHFRAFQKVFAEKGIVLSEHDYYEKYVGLDDKGCFQTLLAANGHASGSEMIAGMIKQKAALLFEQLRTQLVIYPGVVEFIKMAAARFRLAVVSGALRHEIEYSLEVGGVRNQFEHITSAQDTERGKPSPDGYLHALTQLNRKAPLSASECLVIEDTLPGIEAAHAAGMRCLAVSNTFPAARLVTADAVTASLKGYDLVSLERRFWH